VSITKKIILWILIGATTLLIYFSAYLPYAKSRAYINAIRTAQNLRSVDEFKNVFDKVFNFYSPVGSEEVVKFLSNDVLNLISQGQAAEDVSRLLVEYIEPHFFDENVRHMITGARMYETLWSRHGRKEEYFQKSEEYYLKTYAIGPKLPPVLYGLANLYLNHGDFDKAKKLAEEILKYWPDDDRLKPLLNLPPAVTISN